MENRFMGLVIAALIGILIAVIWLERLTGDTRLGTSLTMLVLALPTFFCLWIYRTHDTRELIHQSELFEALRMLTQDELASREIATDILIRLSGKVPAYNIHIKTAFIMAMKGFEPKADEKERRTYAQKMLVWIGDNMEELGVTDMDLKDLVLTNQDFVHEGVFKSEHNHKVITKLLKFDHSSNENFTPYLSHGNNGI